MNAFLQSLRNLGPARLAAMVGVAIGMIGFIIFIAARVSSAPMELLYGDLEASDAGHVAQRLDGLKIPYEVRNGNQIFVPADQVGKLRMQLAEQALPSSGGSVGYEIFDKSDPLGSTSFMQNLNLVRALEGELARSIKTVGNVKTARVHLVMPRREMFSREVQEPSASIILKMNGGGRLNAQQVSSIQHLVAAAVPRLQPTKISIVDDKGTLLARGFEDDKQLMNRNAEEMRISYEQRLARQIEDLLEKTVGFGKVRAEVRADIDFDQLVVNEEKYDPESQVVRSTRTITEDVQAQDQESMPVTVGQNLPDTNANIAGATKNQNKEARNDELVNYEISKKVTKQVRETGVVKRLSVAVLVDGVYNKDGDQRAYETRKQEEMDQIATLVRSAIGFDDKRGDQVDVVNMRFAEGDAEVDKPLDLIFGFEQAQIMRMAEILVLSVVAILVILLVVRPLVTRAFETMPAAAGEAGRKLLAEPGMSPALSGPGMPPAPGVPMEEEMESLDELIDIDKVEGRVKASSIKKIGEIIEKHPEEALSIIRNWMYQEA
ncbi:MAG: flagellar M-ring protein FliF [Alphaproteobacteria bacterium]|nr:flagellar M-ring protein FliF [Alphaproteobacteria bacterium]